MKAEYGTPEACKIIGHQVVRKAVSWVDSLGMQKGNSWLVCLDCNPDQKMNFESIGYYK